jgi:hypothetical protein
MENPPRKMDIGETQSNRNDHPVMKMFIYEFYQFFSFSLNFPYPGRLHPPPMELIRRFACNPALWDNMRRSFGEPRNGREEVLVGSLFGNNLWIKEIFVSWVRWLDRDRAYSSEFFI